MSKEGVEFGTGILIQTKSEGVGPKKGALYLCIRNFSSKNGAAIAKYRGEKAFADSTKLEPFYYHTIYISIFHKIY